MADKEITYGYNETGTDEVEQFLGRSVGAVKHTPWQSTDQFQNPMETGALIARVQAPQTSKSSLPPQRFVYHWENGVFVNYPNKAYKYPTRDQEDFLGPVLPYSIKFFIRSNLDPLGSSSPQVTVHATTQLWEVFNWYFSVTHHSLLSTPQTLEELYFRSIDLKSRTLGEKYYYQQVKNAGLLVRNTDWWHGGVIRALVVSSDRMPKGDYRPREEAADTKPATDTDSMSAYISDDALDLPLS